MNLTAEFFWKLFEATGSVAAYLLYKKYREIVLN
ncbi:MAG: YqzL family protein [Firmicutes bacterium]|nr:YqzL family protein [Bacillota bacterium]